MWENHINFGAGKPHLQQGNVGSTTSEIFALRKPFDYLKPCIIFSFDYINTLDSEATMRAYRKKTDDTYENVARFLHRLVVPLITAQFVVRWTMHVQQHSPPVRLIAWHLASRSSAHGANGGMHHLACPQPPPPHDLPPLIGMLSRTTRALL
jgi:hypothetical protein